MGSYPDICCFRNQKIIKELAVDINNNNNEIANNSNYLTQPNYSSLLFLQARVKRFLNNKNYNSNTNQNNITTSNMSDNNIISNTKNTFPLQNEPTAQFNNIFFQNITEKDDNEDNYKDENNINKIDIIDNKKIYFQNIILNKDLNMFQENLFSENALNYHNKKDPRNGPFDNQRKKYPKLIQNDFSYEGEWKNGKRDGIGILSKKDTVIFIGEFIENKVNGFGKLIDENGDKYIGYWNDSQASGIGLYNKENIITYKGYWNNDKQHGFGIENWPKLKYIGEYLNGNREGYGVLDIKDGIYEGEMKNGNINGVGSFIFKDKRKYEGEFVNNRIQGHGILIWPDGKIFVGSFKDDLEDGFGIFYTTKKIYIGVWQTTLLEGEVIVIEGEKRKKQIWEKGKCYKNLPQNYKIYFEKYVDDIIKQKDFYVK